jgi:poly(A) polymerase
MRILGIGPGPLVGKAYTYLLELRIDRGPLSKEEAAQELRRWAGEAGTAGPAAAPRG